jgi:antitoxin VapB
MALNLRNPEAERLAGEVARLTGESKTEAVVRALRARLERLQRERSGRRLADEVEEIVQRFNKLRPLDERSDDDIVGYDEHGLPR